MTSWISLILKPILLCFLSIEANLNTGELNKGVAFRARSVLTGSRTSNVSASYLGETGTEGNGTYLDIFSFLSSSWHGSFTGRLWTADSQTAAAVVSPRCTSCECGRSVISSTLQSDDWDNSIYQLAQHEQLGCVFCTYFCRIMHYLHVVYSMFPAVLDQISGTGPHPLLS